MSRRVFQRSCGVVPVHFSPSGEPRFLLLNSGQVRNPKATWEFPKGGREEGEGEEQTAIRECREETGLFDVRLVPGYRAIDVYIFHRSGVRIKKWVVYFLAIVDDPSGMKPEPDGREHVLDGQGRWYQWLTFEQAKKTLYHSGQKRVLASAWAHLSALQLDRVAALERTGDDRLLADEGSGRDERPGAEVAAGGGLDR